MHWTPMKEAYPPKEGRYLTYFPSADPALPFIYPGRWTGTHWDMYPAAWNTAVTHWMEIPAPPDTETAPPFARLVLELAELIEFLPKCQERDYAQANLSEAEYWFMEANRTSLLCGDRTCHLCYPSAHAHSVHTPHTPPHPDCTQVLRAEGKSYPKTCKVCGLGPCTQALKINGTVLKP